MDKKKMTRPKNVAIKASYIRLTLFYIKKAAIFFGDQLCITT